jgi:mRNA-degrading endonuclease RelE of RelBE toxin-antitoxin system
MSTRYQILTHPKVKKFVDGLDRIQKARVDRLYDLFEDYGPNLPSRYLKKVFRDIWELRPGDVRLFLTIRGNKGFVVHGILKKGRRLPRKELELAVQRVREDEI